MSKTTPDERFQLRQEAKALRIRIAKLEPRLTRHGRDCADCRFYQYYGRPGVPCWIFRGLLYSFMKADDRLQALKDRWSNA